jgi:hypothetical protein
MVRPHAHRFRYGDDIFFLTKQGFEPLSVARAAKAGGDPVTLVRMADHHSIGRVFTDERFLYWFVHSDEVRQDWLFRAPRAVFANGHSLQWCATRPCPMRGRRPEHHGVSHAPLRFYDRLRFRRVRGLRLLVVVLHQLVVP